MSLYLKYRPQDLEEVYGNEELISSLKTKLDGETHSFLIHGPTGCGKTTIGRIIAKELGVKGQDFKELDSADFRGIDTVREIRRNSQFHPMEGERRMWLMDECHKMTNDAQNALLKILEDTPSHVYFVLCTTDPQNLLPTIKGRCSQFQVKPLTEKQLFRLLRTIAAEEDVEVEKEVLEQIADSSQGLVRNAIQILDQVLTVDAEDRVEVAKRQVEVQNQSIDLCRALIKETTRWKEIQEILKGLKGEDAESIRRVVLGYCQSVLLNSDSQRAGVIMEQFMEPTYNAGFPMITYNCYNIIKNN